MSGDAQTSPPPPVLWAHRLDTVVVTICLEDCTKPDIKISDDKIYFKGIGGTDKKEYEVTINLYEEIDSVKSSFSIQGRVIEFVLQKKDDTTPSWPRLTKEKVKYHWLKVDFNKWEDVDQIDPIDQEMGPCLKHFKNLDKCTCRTTNFDRVIESDSDDEELPDLF